MGLFKALFSGFFDGQFIWGRGSSDCKNNLIGILEAVELLIDAGFKPKRTLILSFGFDEEISGREGAGTLAKTLVSKAIDLMIAKDADEIALETEETNITAMKLYESLGFLRSKKLHRYYLNGSNAYRLLLYLKPGIASIPMDDFFDPYGYGALPPSAQDDPRYLDPSDDLPHFAVARGIHFQSHSV